MFSHTTLKDFGQFPKMIQCVSALNNMIFHWYPKEDCIACFPLKSTVQNLWSCKHKDSTDAS